MSEKTPKYFVDYTWVKTKNDDTKSYDLSDPAMRRLYFNNVVGDENRETKSFLKGILLLHICLLLRWQEKVHIPQC
jgi:hypothetical protein